MKATHNSFILSCITWGAEMSPNLRAAREISCVLIVLPSWNKVLLLYIIIIIKTRGGGVNFLYCVWYRCATGIASIFQVIYTPIGHNFFSNIVTKWIKSCLLQCFGTFKIPILMFISILVFRPEGQIWNPVRRDTRIYVWRILNASRISKTQLNSCTISPS